MLGYMDVCCAGVSPKLTGRNLVVTWLCVPVQNPTGNRPGYLS